jgi:hypothetical protein
VACVLGSRLVAEGVIAALPRSARRRLPSTPILLPEPDMPQQSVCMEEVAHG